MLLFLTVIIGIAVMIEYPIMIIPMIIIIAIVACARK